MGTNFFTNEKENTLLEKIEGVFKYKEVHFFDALVGYFRASGYFRIRKFIQQTPQIRILVGINVDKTPIKQISRDYYLILTLNSLKKSSLMTLNVIYKRRNTTKRSRMACISL